MIQSKDDLSFYLCEGQKRNLHLADGGCIINCKAMDNYCDVNSSVIIGNKDGQENRATIGNYVPFTPGVKVIGKVSIGDCAIVTPNSVFIQDVPTYGVVSGVPAVLIKIHK